MIWKNLGVAQREVVLTIGIPRCGSGFQKPLRSGFEEQCYNRSVFKPAVITTIFLAGIAYGQQEPKQPAGTPQVKLNYLNVCSPSAEEQAVLNLALSKVSANPAFGEDFEITRGLVTLKDAPSSKFVRLRRDFASHSPMMTAQYSMSIDENSAIETLVLRMRDPKEFHEISIEDRVTAGAASPVSIIGTDTPAARVRIERLGKSSIVLARCEGADQNAFEPFFKQASDLMARYRAVLGLRTAFRADIAWLAGSAKADGEGRAAQKTPK